MDLTRQDAKQRLIEYGANSLKQTHKSSALMLLINGLSCCAFK
ncbi:MULTISPECIES: cation-transporting P-type ATPase [unclassified Microcoleus]